MSILKVLLIRLSILIDRIALFQFKVRKHSIRLIDSVDHMLKYKVQFTSLKTGSTFTCCPFNHSSVSAIIEWHFLNTNHEKINKHDLSISSFGSCFQIYHKDKKIGVLYPVKGYPSNGDVLFNFFQRYTLPMVD